MPRGAREGRAKGGALAYPARSRRSGGLSIGINLFPTGKRCQFGCPYCEVFPPPAGPAISARPAAEAPAGNAAQMAAEANAPPQNAPPLEARSFEAPPLEARHSEAPPPRVPLARLEAELRALLAWARESGEPAMDVCFSGAGEPTLSPDFPAALELAARARAEEAPGAKLVLITNGAGLLEPRVFSLLRGAARGPEALDVWLKLDAATPGWREKINATRIPHEALLEKAAEFAACAPVTLQAMLCAVDGAGPPEEEERAWERLAAGIAAAGAGNVRAAQIYGKARPSPGDPRSSPLPAERLHARAESLRLALAALCPALPAPLPVRVYP